MAEAALRVQEDGERIELALQKLSGMRKDASRVYAIHVYGLRSVTRIGGLP
jgi:hypothetical protein